MTSAAHADDINILLKGTTIALKQNVPGCRTPAGIALFNDLICNAHEGVDWKLRPSRGLRHHPPRKNATLASPAVILWPCALRTLQFR
jgi:hypothetical protein